MSIAEYSINFSLYPFQQYLTAFGSTITVPFVLYEALCINNDAIGLGQLINTIFFVSGVSTLLQTTVGVRSVYS